MSSVVMCITIIVVSSIIVVISISASVSMCTNRYYWNPLDISTVY